MYNSIGILALFVYLSASPANRGARKRNIGVRTKWTDAIKDAGSMKIMHVGDHSF